MADSPSLDTVLNAISDVESVGMAAAPNVILLVSEVKALFSAPDQATIELALSNLDALADAQHEAAQGTAGV
jgi:hypothetical protein